MQRLIRIIKDVIFNNKSKVLKSFATDRDLDSSTTWNIQDSLKSSAILIKRLIDQFLYSIESHKINNSPSFSKRGISIHNILPPLKIFKASRDKDSIILANQDGHLEKILFGKEQPPKSTLEIRIHSKSLTFMCEAYKLYVIPELWYKNMPNTSTNKSQTSLRHTMTKCYWRDTSNSCESKRSIWELVCFLIKATPQRHA